MDTKKLVWAWLAILFIAIIVVTISENKFENKCIDAGGEYHYSRSKSMCVEKGSIINID